MRFDSLRLQDLYRDVTAAIWRAEHEETRAAWLLVAELEEAIVLELDERDGVELDIAKRSVISAKEKAAKAER